MDYEDFLSEIYAPIKSIELLSDIIYTKANEDWNLLSSCSNRNDFDELMALNFLIGLCAQHLQQFRENELGYL